MQNLLRHKYFYLLLLTLVIFLVFLISFENKKKEERKAKLQVLAVEKKKEELRQTLSLLPLKAQAVYVFDSTERKTIYAKNEKEVLPIASLAKIMTGILVMKDTEKTEVEILAEDLKEFGNHGLNIGEIFKKEDLLVFTLLLSSNDSAKALGRDADFVERMNSYAKENNFHNTSFLNPTGLDVRDESSAQSTAQEITELALRALRLYPDIFKQTALKEVYITSLSGVVHDADNTNIILDKIPNPIFSKTGFTKKAGGNLIVIFKDSRGHEISVVVLGSTREDRFTDVEKIVNVVYNTSYE